MTKSIWQRVKPWCVPLGLTLLIYILLRSVFLIGYIPSASMEPTLHEGSFILGLRLYSEPKVGDIIIFEKDGVLLVKRIAACPGDPVDLSQLEYVTTIPIPVWEETVLTVPEGCYFVLGDNAQNSWDSRYWEQPYVFRQQIVAKLIVITRAGKYSFHYDFGGQRAMPVKQRYIAFCTLNKTKGTADANHTGGISPT